jgi:cellulose synthase/poly-beta-1,6-N-acetylglucosamine synthase-like glycosyltransferase
VPPYPLYAITQVGLDSQLFTRPVVQPGQGSYVVVWWKEIALGHVFLEPDQLLTEAAYEAALIAAITPAVQHYAAQQHRTSDSWQQWLAQRDFERVGAWLDALLAEWLPASLPPRVPVSAIICTRNRAPQLRRCLHMLHTLACAPTEIVVVDNAPTDNSTYEVCQEFAGVVYRKEPRAGLDFARNTGIATAQCPVVAFVDDDVVVHPWLLYNVWETFQDPATAAMTGLVLPISLHTEAQLVFEQYWSFNRGYVDALYGPTYMLARAGHAPKVWEIGAGANMAFRKSIFEKVGYFDELLGAGAAGCGDDSEMWYRILAHGYTIRYNPRAVVYHEHRQEMAGLKHQLFYYMRGHAAALLIQQAQQPQAGYERRLYHELPKYYYNMFRVGFPHFRFRSQTMWVEIKGLVSGIVFYYRNRSPKPLP